MGWLYTLRNTRLGSDPLFLVPGVSLYNALYSYCQSVEGKLLHLLYEWIPRVRGCKWTLPPIMNITTTTPEYTPDLRTRPPIQNVAQLQPLSGLGEAQEQSTDVVQRMLNGVLTGEQFVMDNIIGKGTFGEVYACQLPNGSLVAVKKVHKSKVLTIQTISCISHEFRMLREPDLTRRHQNIMYIDDVLQSRSHLYIVMALGGKVSNGGGTGEGMHADGQGPYGRVRSCKQTRGTPLVWPLPLPPPS